MSLNAAVLMFIAHRHVEQRVLEHLHAGGFADLTAAQARLAARIDEGGSRLTQLAESAQVTKQTAGFLVDQLERAGYVVRLPDPSDARARLVTLAARGEAARRRAREVEVQLEAEWRGRLGERRWAELERSLEDLRELTDPYLRESESAPSGNGPGSPEAT